MQHTPDLSRNTQRPKSRASLTVSRYAFGAMVAGLAIIGAGVAGPAWLPPTLTFDIGLGLGVAGAIAWVIAQEVSLRP